MSLSPFFDRDRPIYIKFAISWEHMVHVYMFIGSSAMEIFYPTQSNKSLKRLTKRTQFEVSMSLALYFSNTGMFGSLTL